VTSTPPKLHEPAPARTEQALARVVVDRCRRLAACSETPGVTTRTFLSPPMRDVHALVEGWMRRARMDVTVDAAGNLRGVYAAERVDAPRVYIGSHLDTVPGAGAFDGILGVMLGVAIVERLEGRRFPFGIEVVGFSEEEGVRFGTPFIGSRAFTGTLDAALLSRLDAGGVSVREAISAYGLDPHSIGSARADDAALGFLEIHIEQGPVLDDAGLALAVVDAIVGQTRLEMTFEGAANHAGTTPMAGRRDAVAGAAEWVVAVEREARSVAGLVATVGRVRATPGATNVIAASCQCSLDVRHAGDSERQAAVGRCTEAARQIATARSLNVHWDVQLDQSAVAMDAGLIERLDRAVAEVGVPRRHMASGAGHDAMIVASRMPAAMLFVRSPGGISHHPDEAVEVDDVAAAIAAGGAFLEDLARQA
jgi:allantoate deiminase